MEKYNLTIQPACLAQATICIHTLLQTYIHTYIHAYTYIHIRIYMYIHTYINIYILHIHIMYIQIDTLIHTYIHTYITCIPMSECKPTFMADDLNRWSPETCRPAPGFGDYVNKQVSLRGKLTSDLGACIHWTIVRSIHVSGTSCEALFKQVLIKIGKQL